MRDSRPNAELAIKTLPLPPRCGQDSDKINANINLQLRALTGLYESAPSRLALQQGGGSLPTGAVDAAAELLVTFN